MASLEERDAIAVMVRGEYYGAVSVSELGVKMVWRVVWGVVPMIRVIRDSSFQKFTNDDGVGNKDNNHHRVSKDDDDDLCMAITPSSDLTLRNNSV